MKQPLLSLYFLCISLTVFGQFTGPDAANKIYYTKGFVGVGDVPLYKFHLKGSDDKPLFFGETHESTFAFTRHFIDLRAKSSFANTPYIAWYTPGGKRQAYIGWENNYFNLTLENGFNYCIKGGNVGIGTTDTKGYMLAVGGKAVAEEIVVKLKANWPDYVFHSNYKPIPIDELSRYISIHHRLPEVPSAKEVNANGINVNDMTTLLLKKVEELTLYLIESREEADELRARVRKLETTKELSTRQN